MLRAAPIPFFLPYGGAHPSLAEPLGSYGPGSAVLGRATIGSDCTLQPLAVIRADGHYVQIGDGFWLGARSTVHIAHEVYPCIIGDRVTVGTNACVHACTVGNDCVIGDGAVILDGSTVQDYVVLEEGSIVFPRSVLETGYLYAGSPAKPVRPIEPHEVEEPARRIRTATTSGAAQPAVEVSATAVFTAVSPSTFVAATARVHGVLRTEENSSVWFGCDLDAGPFEITIGLNSNIQDNTSIRCSNGPLALGHGSVIGHNVELANCTIGDRSLIGIGSVVSEGTIVENDVLLAAGAKTSPGQRLESGWVWAGSPARPIGRLDDKKRKLIAWTVETYSEYAQSYRSSQEQLLRRRA
jgi:carbonic anhydrase/acetyltransferase-like protein (isoleucine patch superfamily)